jgi:CubicO group peptidase (beta-lactamase class C family)
MPTTEIIASSIIDGELRTRHSEAVLPWWSFGKTALAAAALALVEDGKLSLDGSFQGRLYTLRQLLQHTAGIPNYGGLEAYRQAVESGAEPWPAPELLDRVKAEELLFAPDNGWAYSNVGYLLVRQAVERASGEGLEQALGRLVFRPLGIDGVRLAETPADLERTLWGNPGGYHPGWVYHGLLVGTVDAAALFMDRLVAGDLLADEFLDAMLTGYPVGGPLPQRPFRQPSYGLGVMIEAAEGERRCVGHTGQGPGSTAAVYSFTELERPVTVAAFAPEDYGDQSQGMLEEHAIKQALRLGVG